MAEKSEIVKDRGKILINVATSDKGFDKMKVFDSNAKEENTFEINGNNVDVNGTHDIDNSREIDGAASLMLALSLEKDANLGNVDEVWINEASENGSVTDDVDDKDSECDTTLVNKYEDSEHDVDIICSTDNSIDISDELTNATDSMMIDPLNVECEPSNENDRTTDMSEDIKKDGLTLTEMPSLQSARIVFDATDMDKGCTTMRLKADTPMREIKKLFPKHLSATEDTFMLYFNNREVEDQTPLQLFGNNLEGENNVIKIVKSVKINFEGQAFLEERLQGRYLDVRQNAPFSELRQTIADFLREPKALTSLVYNDQEIVNDQTPETLKMRQGGVLKVIKKDEMKIRLRGSIFDKFQETHKIDNFKIDINPNYTMRAIKSIISRSVNEDPRKIELIYKGREPRDQATPISLGMSDTDILFANLKFGVTIKIKGPVGEIESFYPERKPLKWLFQSYTEKHQMASSAGKHPKSFIFRFLGRIVNTEDTAQSLNLVDGDFITVCEVLTTVFEGPIFKMGYDLLDIDTQRKFKDVKEHVSDKIGVDSKDLVFTINEERVVGDDDTFESLNIRTGTPFISVSVQQNIQVHVWYSRLGQESQTFTSKMGSGIAAEKWKSEISAELGEPLHYLSFTWEDSEIADFDTPEQIGIQNGDTVKVHSSSVIQIHIERDGEVLTDYSIHVDKDFFGLWMWYSREFHACINSFEFKFGERDIFIFDTANKIGLEKGGTIQVFHPKQEDVMTVEFYVENSSLLTNYPRLKEFPLLWDASSVEQVIWLKMAIGALFGNWDGIEGTEEWFEDGIDTSGIILLHNAKEMCDTETLGEIGISKGDKIVIDVREPKLDEKEVSVFVRRNLKETKSSMGKGIQDGDEETCIFKLDSTKPLSEFIKKVKSRITCSSKKDKLFLAFNDALVNKEEMVNKDERLFFIFNDAMVNKGDFAKQLKQVSNPEEDFPLHNYFKCYAFPNLEAFKKHLETSQGENESFMGSFSDRYYSLSSEDLDVPTSMSNYKPKHGEEQSSDERKRDIEKKLKALQMRINIDKKKKEKIESVSLAKDLQNHKDFENLDDILKFIGEEDLTSQENKDEVGTSKRRKSKNKKKIKTTTNNESDKSKVQDFTGDDFLVEVSVGQDDARDNKQNDIQDVLYEAKDSRNKHVKVGSLQMKEQNNTNRKESDKKVKTVTGSTMDDLQDEVQRNKGDEQSKMKGVKKKGKKQKRNNETNQSKDKTSQCSFVCNICTFINHRDTIFCDICGNNLITDEQNWQKVGIVNKRKLVNKTRSEEKSSILKSKASTFSHPEKLLQKSEQKSSHFSKHEKLSEEPDLKMKEPYIEEHVDKPSQPKQQVSTFHREDQKQSKNTVQVKAKTEIFLESEKAIEFPKILETCFINKLTSKRNQSGKDGNNTKIWTASEMDDYRRSEIGDNETTEENEDNEPEDELIPVLTETTETEEETRKWSQLMVAARKKRDAERKRDYLKFRDMQSRSTRPQLDEIHHGSNAQMFRDEVPSGKKPVVPQPMGTVKYYSGETQGASIAREGRPQGRHQFGPSFETNNPSNPFFPRLL